MEHIIILVGLPGSGKSTICAKYPNYVRVSQDEQGKDGHKVVFHKAISEGKDVIIDRVNFNKDQRNRYLKVAKQAGYRTTIIRLTAKADECINRLMNRTNHPNLNGSDPELCKKVVNMFDGMMVEPDQTEADEIIVV